MKLLLSRINFDKEDLHIHATTSEIAAKSIIKNGLYTYGDDLYAFSFLWCGNMKNDYDIESILTYGYGGITESSKAENYVILFRVPKDQTNLEELSEEEQKKAQSLVETRRMGIMMVPTHKISNKEILGYIDKEKGQVIFNPNYVQEKTENFRESNIHDEQE